jgi:hypothetical protein
MTRLCLDLLQRRLRKSRARRFLDPIDRASEENVTSGFREHGSWFLGEGKVLGLCDSKGGNGIHCGIQVNLLGIYRC